jgi:hypothetical protein
MSGAHIEGASRLPLTNRAANGKARDYFFVLKTNT